MNIIELLKDDSFHTAHRCANCRAIKSDHTDDLLCLFAPTQYQEMTPAEYLTYREERETALKAYGKAVSDHLYDMVGKQSFARSILLATPVKEEEKP